MQYDAQLQLSGYKLALIWLNHGLITRDLDFLQQKMNF